MEYKGVNTNKLDIKSGKANKLGNYWITIDFTSEVIYNQSIYPMRMTYHALVKNDKILNKDICLMEGSTIIKVFTHYHDDELDFDETYTEIGYRTPIKSTYNTDSMRLDNLRISDEEEKMLVDGLFQTNEVEVDIDSLLKIFQKSLKELKYLSRNDLSREEKEVHFRAFKQSIDRVLKVYRQDGTKRFVKEKVDVRI